MPFQAEPRQPDLNDQGPGALDSDAADVVLAPAIPKLAASGWTPLTPGLAKIVMFQRQSVGTTRGRND